MVLDYKAIGKRIKLVRNDKNISKNDIAKQLKITENDLNKIEQGNIEINLVNIVKLSEILDISIDYLVKGIEKKENLKKEFEKILDKCTKKQEEFILEIAELTTQMNL